MTTEKFKDIITISKLPSECFDEIFKYLKFDRRSLYSCLFVNRFWCRKVIPIIWRRPMPYNPTRMNIINIEVFIPFFNEEEKSYLLNEGIDISKLTERPVPLFNYAQYIHILDVGAIEIATITWFNNLKKSQQFDKTSNPLSMETENLKNKCRELETTTLQTDTSTSQATNAMVDSLCRIFMRSANNLKYLILSPYDVNKDIPKSNIFVNNEPGLVNLRKLKLRFYTNSICQHEQRGNLYDLLKVLPNICNGLVHLDINRIKIPNHSTAEILAGLITSQPELTYCRFYKVYGEICLLMSVLPAHKLTHLVFDDMIFSGISLTSLSQCTRLESLVLRKCRLLTLESIQPILKASIKLKFLHLGELTKDVVKAIIVKASDALEQASIKIPSDEIIEILETLVNHCQNITHLSLCNDYGRVDISGIITNINLLKNLSHLKLSVGVINGEIELDSEFSKLGLEKLQYLELINISVKALQGYLSKCCSPLSTVIIDTIEENNIKIFLDFSKEKNSLRWVGIDRIYESNFDKCLETYKMNDSKVCRKINELAEGYFKVFPAKQVRIREKYF
ncbi:hypothetical protein C1645_741928 [Glomus cerebriforme]|uniref:F-box domain-containing protein n=1 Tax=Glomus cerebriforme TaxID=658196 RepID=A0A397SFD9_9GLOM|nr:hypothetical protein C1645_741928 [Glomus cerebriforme]